MNIVMSTRYKFCPRCRGTKLFSEFAPCSRGLVRPGLDKRRSYCRVCMREWQREKWRQDPGYRQRAIEAQRAWYYKDVEHSRALARDWADRNPEKVRARYWKRKEYYHQYGHAHYIKNKDRYREWTRSWRAAHPESIRALTRASRARRKGASGKFNVVTIQRLWWFQKGLCQYCNVQLKSGYHVDHMIPITRGGTNLPQNLCLACASCNSSKNTRTAEEFYALRRTG